jgi:hypothetical protein
MLAKGIINPKFRLYWDEMDRCQSTRTYWALLHVTVCLPDICAALDADNGKTNGPRYVAWCDRYLPDASLSGSERWEMRCKVLHEGRASIRKSTRYTGYSFAQPADTGEVDHRRLDGFTFILDVGQLANEYRAGVLRWIASMEAKPSSRESCNVARNLPSIVEVRRFAIPALPGAQPLIAPFSSRTS